MPPASACLSKAAVPHAVFGIPVDQVAGEDQVAEDAMIRADRPRLWRCVAQLPARQRYVIVHRYGLAGTDRRTLRELAAELGVAPDTVQRLERAGLELLREWF